MVKTSYEWKKLLMLSMSFLKSANILYTAWTFGGGTALRYYYNHRYSQDIDIFLHDAQLLTYLTPRLNDYVEDKIDDYEEMSNSLKLKIGNQEIDFIIAPFLTKKPINTITLNGKRIRIETKEEIIIKKIFYRCNTFKVRDIVDFAVVIKNDKQSLLDNMDICEHKLFDLKNRINLLINIYPKEISELQILDESLIDSALDIVLDFLKEEI